MVWQERINGDMSKQGPGRRCVRDAAHMIGGSATEPQCQRVLETASGSPALPDKEAEQAIPLPILSSDIVFLTLEHTTTIPPPDFRKFWWIVGDSTNASLRGDYLFFVEFDDRMCSI